MRIWHYWKTNCYATSRLRKVVDQVLWSHHSLWQKDMDTDMPIMLTKINKQVLDQEL